MRKNYFLFSGLLTILLSFFVLSNQSSAQLYINEFMASNIDAYPGPQDDYPDWIEIYNAGNEDVMMGGFLICDTLDPTVAYQIPATYPDSVTVAAGGYILFYANKDTATSVLNLNFKLSGDGEQIGLWTNDATLVDNITYDEQTEDVSYGRYPDGADSWFFMPDFTPAEANTDPTPAELKLYINEFMASNIDALPGPQGDFPDWIEIYNAGTEDIMLGGFFLCDTLDVTQAFQISDAYPDSVTVDAGGFIVFYANNDDELSVLNLNFKLSGDGEQIGLWGPDQSVLDAVTYTTQLSDTSYGRYADGTDNWIMMPDYTPGEANQDASAIATIDYNIIEVQNFPNPFSNETNIQFTLKKSEQLRIEILDARGAFIKVIADGKYSGGTHSVIMDASDLPAGNYFYSLKTSAVNYTRKVLVVK